jgi:predicted ester cyclase
MDAIKDVNYDKLKDKMSSTEENKRVVIRFNKEVLEQGDRKSFDEIMHKDFINRTAPSNASDSTGLWNTLTTVLHAGFSDLKVDILDQVAEGDKVTSRKTITGTHSGTLMGVTPTNKRVVIDVIDIVHVKDGKYFEHWGINTLPVVINELRKSTEQSDI